MAYQADIVVRVTSDCPLIDPGISGMVISFLQNNFSSCDYASTVGYPRGLDTEAFSFRVLEEAFCEAKEQPEREHVTPFIYRSHKERYRLHEIKNTLVLPPHRWTVDTPEDLRLVENILTELYPRNKDFTWQEVLALFEQHSDWFAINAHIEQKKYGQ